MNSLQDVQIGMEIVNISIQDAEPPTSRVMEAFKAVETAKQGADTAVNNARQYRNEQIPAAEAEADKIVQEAEARKQARIAEAESGGDEKTSFLRDNGGYSSGTESDHHGREYPVRFTARLICRCRRKFRSGRHSWRHFRKQQPCRQQ